MRLGIIGAIGVDDIGDVVMLEAGLKQLKVAGKNNLINIDFTIFALDNKKAERQIGKIDIDAKVTNSLTTKDLTPELLRNLCFNELLRVDLLSNINNNEFISNFKECDALFFIGGGYFNKYWWNKLFPTFVIPIALGHQLDKPIFISGINVGPFSKSQVGNLNGIFKKIDTLILRDRDISIKTLEELGGVDGNLILGADDILPVWYNKNHNYKPIELRKDIKYAVIQLHHWVEIYSKSYIEFYKNLAAFLNEMLDKNFLDKIYFLPFTYFKGVDYECGRRLKTFMNDREQYLVLEPTDNHVFMRELISNSEFVIGSRYHPVVYGLGEQVPTLGIYVNDLYKQKISGAYDVVEVKKENNMIYVNDITQERLMDWYFDVDKNYSNIKHKKTINLIDKYSISKRSSIEDFIVKIKK